MSSDLITPIRGDRSAFRISIGRIRKGSEVSMRILGTGGGLTDDPKKQARQEMLAEWVCSLANLKLHARKWRLQQFAEILLAALDNGIAVHLEPILDDDEEDSDVADTAS